MNRCFTCNRELTGPETYGAPGECFCFNHYQSAMDTCHELAIFRSGTPWGWSVEDARDEIKRLEAELEKMYRFQDPILRGDSWILQGASQ